MIRTLALVAIILTAACSPDAGVGPTDRGSNGGTTTTATTDKRASSDSAQTTCGSAWTQGKRSCDTNRWNGSTAKR